MPPFTRRTPSSALYPYVARALSSLPSQCSHPLDFSYSSIPFFDIHTNEHGHRVVVSMSKPAEELAAAANAIDMNQCSEVTEPLQRSSYLWDGSNCEDNRACCSPYQYWNIATHLAAAIANVVYALVRSQQVFSNYNTRVLNSWWLHGLWVFHFTVVGVDCLLYTTSVLYHAITFQYHRVAIFVRSLDIGVIAFAAGVHFVMDALIAIASFWYHAHISISLMNSNKAGEDPWLQSSFESALQSTWRLLLDGVLCSSGALLFILISHNSEIFPKTLRAVSLSWPPFFWSEPHIQKCDAVAVHVATIGLNALLWVTLIGICFSSLPTDASVWYLASRVASLVIILLFDLLHKVSIVFKCLSGCNMVTTKLHKQAFRFSAIQCSNSIRFPTAHAIWHVASFLAVSLITISSDYILTRLSTLPTSTL